MSHEPFSRSLAAQKSAICVIASAQELELIDGPIAVDERLAEAEKELMLKVMSAVKERKSDGVLSADEISSMFTFVYARAAEAVTNLANNQPNNFDMMGLFDGKVPLCAEDILTGHFKKLDFPTVCARKFWKYYEEGLDNSDPALALFESLKWCFRLSCHLAVRCLEEHNYRFI